MNKTKIMGIGIGRAGNVILDEFLKKDRRYSGLFVNSAYGDAEDLEKFDIDKNAYIFPATSGSGRDRNFAKTFLKDHVQGLADTIARYPAQDLAIIFFSLDGGTGSGVGTLLPKVLKRTCPNKKINLIGIIPDYKKSDKVSFKNTIDCWNEIAELSEAGIIDDVKFVDNSKRRTFDEINKKLVDDLDNAFNLNGKCEFGSIDDNDAKRVNTAQGYGLILTLDSKYNNLNDAIDYALQDTVFAKPNQYTCDYLAASLKDFDVTQATEQFEYLSTAYVAENQSHNTIVLGGCDEPSEVIETIKMAYDELMEKSKARSKNKRTIIKLDDNNTNANTKSESKEVKTTFTSKELDTLFDDLF